MNTNSDCWLTPKSPADSWELQAEEKTLYGQVEEAILSSLRPAIVYQVRVFAENELGRSKEGRVLQVSIYQEVELFMP